MTSVTLLPGAENRELLTEQSLTYRFTYDVIKGSTSTPDPVSFKYRVVLSMTGDLEDPGNRDILVGEQTHTVTSQHEQECKWLWKILLQNYQSSTASQKITRPIYSITTTMTMMLVR